MRLERSKRMSADLQLIRSELPGDWPSWVCPDHGSQLRAAADRLECEAAHSFAVRGGIPRFVASGTYAESFGVQWNHYRTTQLDSYTGTSITRDRLRRCCGDELWNRLENLHVLECGCGAGRFTEQLLAQGARVTSIDLSEAVDANQANFPQDGRHRIAQADIMRLPFASQSYDVVCCLGVIQHTPEPERTIAALHDFVAPGGWLIFDHYTYDLSRLTKLSAPLLRAVGKRMPAAQGLRFTEMLVDVFLPLHRVASRSRVAHALLSRVSPIQAYYGAYPQLSNELQREWALLDTHDGLTDWYKHLRSRSQLERVVAALGLVEIHCARGGNGVEVRGRRPWQENARP
jgi:SAM-dependent methyltransferase